MSTAPRARAALPSAEDDFYGQEGEEAGNLGRNDGTGGGSDDRPAGTGQAEEDAAFDLDPEQTPGGEEDLGGDDPDDFFAPPPSRGAHRQQTLANENRELRRQLDTLRGVQPSAAAPAAPAGPRFETDQEFDARIQLLDFEARMEERYRRDRMLQNMQNTQVRLETAIATDRATFEARAAKDKRVARWADRVEAEFTRRQQLGQLVSRVDILKWMIGDRIVDGDEAPTRRERERAGRRVAAQTTRPVNTGSDVRPARRGQLTDREQRARRLENVQI